MTQGINFKPIEDYSVGDIQKMLKSDYKPKDMEVIETPARINPSKLKGIEPGKIYELIFTKCGCPLYTHAKINSNNLCECSRQSMICVFKNLVPQKNFKIECTESILAGNKKCCHKIVFDD